MNSKDLNIFQWPVRVYYEDTDAAGVVYYANYLKFMERARTEWLRDFGFEQDALREQGIIFVVRNVAIDYLRPALFNQLLTVETIVMHYGKASISFDQKVIFNEQKLAVATIKLACINEKTFRPVPIPETILKEMKHVC